MPPSAESAVYSVEGFVSGLEADWFVWEEFRNAPMMIGVGPVSWLDSSARELDW